VILDVGDQPARMPEDVEQGLEHARQVHRQDLALLIAGATGQKWVALPVVAPR
jgi:hypothetical protein